MPNIKSAKKRVKVIAAKTLQNKIFKTSLKNVVKKYEKALADSDKSTVASAYTDAIKKIDKAVARGAMHKNTAARRKSSFTKKLNALGA